MPRVGGPVRIEHLGLTEGGVVRAVDLAARRVEVMTDDGRVVGFALNPATATFTIDGSQTGARLRF